MTAFRLRVGSKTDVGRARDRNEDSYLLKEPLFVIADGMGGHRGGDVASSMAVDSLNGIELPEDTPLTVLVERIKEANRDVLQRGDADSNLRGMGTTVTALLAEDAKAHVVHVGDSRAYLYRNGALQQLTEDHTLVQRMVREGRLTPEQARNHPQRSIVTRVLGVDEDLQVDELTLDVHPGDRFLLCSDGLTGMLDEDRIAGILEAEGDPQAAADQLVREANREGGEDNITVILVDVEDDATGSNDGSGDRIPTRAVTAVAAAPEAERRPRPAATDTASRPSEPAEGEDGADVRVWWKRLVLWVGAVVITVVVVLIAVRIYVNHQWYVGASNGRVAIYHGIPAVPLGIHLSHVYTQTGMSSVRAERLQPYRDLEDGITASSLQDARDIVRQIQRDLAESSRGG